MLCGSVPRPPDAMARTMPGEFAGPSLPATPQMGKVLPRWGLASALRRLGFGEPVLLEPVEERLVRQVEQARRAGAIAARELERLAQASRSCASHERPLGGRRKPPSPCGAVPRARAAGRRAGPRRPRRAASAARRRWRARGRSPARRSRSGAVLTAAEKRACGRPCRRAARAAKCSTRSGMSSRRSRSGGSSERHDVQAVVEILAEAARRRPRPRGRGWSPRRRARRPRSRRSPPTRVTSPSCSARSSFGCSASGSSPISSRKSVPPSAASKRPGARAVGAGEGAALDAEELRLEQSLGDRRAVDRDERPRAARRELVQRARRELLAGAALAGEENRRLRCRRGVRRARRGCCIAADRPMRSTRRSRSASSAVRRRFSRSSRRARSVRSIAEQERLRARTVRADSRRRRRGSPRRRARCVP